MIDIPQKTEARSAVLLANPVAGSSMLPPVSDIDICLDTPRPRIGLATRKVLAENLYFGVLNTALALVLMILIWSALGSVLWSAATAFATALAGTPTH
jgi:hypothetical protein